MSRRRHGWSDQQHRDAAITLAQMSSELVAMVVKVGRDYPMSSPAYRAARAAERALGSLRNALDNQASAENDEAPSPYYTVRVWPAPGGDA